MRLPGVGPVGLLDEPRLEVADRPQPERLEMAEVALRPLDGGANRRDVDDRQVRPDQRRPGEVDARRQALVDQLERRLDARPARRRPRQDLGHGLDGLVVGGDRELQPGAGDGGRGVEVDARERVGGRRRRVNPGPASRAARRADATVSPPSAAYCLEQLALALA